MSGFDPIISLNGHIAFLTLLQAARKEVEEVKGIRLLAAKGVGQIIVEELNKSRATMKDNKMWVQDVPIGERRYRYSLFGSCEEHEISQSDLHLHVSMVKSEIERCMKNE